MGKGMIKRTLSVFLTMMLTVSVFGICAIESNAVDPVIDVTLSEVTRCYLDSLDILEKINEYREEKDLEPWEMDTDLLEKSMVRASELSVYTSVNAPDGSCFSDDSSELRSELYGYNVTLLRQFIPSLINSDYERNILESNVYNAVGVGIVEVRDIRYIYVLTAKRNVNAVDSSVYDQGYVEVDQPIRTKSSIVSTVTMSIPDGDMFCGDNIPLRLIAQNKTYSGGTAYISASSCIVTSSDTSIIEVNNDNTVIGVKKGYATVTLTLKGDSSIKASATYHTVAQDFVGCNISDIPDQTYSGNAITPQITMTDQNNQPLYSGIHYTVKYMNNIEVGTALAIITGIGNYTGAQATKEFRIVGDANAFSATIKTSSTNVELGEIINVSASVTNASGTVYYTFENAPENSSDFTVFRASSTSATCTFTPSTTGVQVIRVIAKDSAGRTAIVSTQIKVSRGMYCDLSITSTDITLGNSVTAEVTAYGGNPAYSYSFAVITPDSTVPVTIQDYGTASAVTYTPPKSGTYQIYSYVRDQKNKTVSAYKTFNVKASQLTNNSTVSKTTAMKGTNITLKGAASGGSQPYKYAFYYKRQSNTSWQTIGTAFDSSTSKSFTIPAADTFDIKITVKDSENTTKDKTFTVKGTAVLANNSTISAATFVKGGKVTLTGAASGGVGSYKYAYYYKKSGDSSWTDAGGGFVSAATMDITLPESTAYTAKVTVKDSDGNTADKTFSLLPAAELVNNSRISSLNVTAGTEVTLTGAASGGSAPYKYAFYYKRSTNDSYITIGTAFTSDTTQTFTPSAAATFNIKIVVKDSAGSTKEKIFTLTSTKALVNKSTMSASTMTSGSSVKLTASGEGGISPYKYAFYYKRSSSSTWKVIGDEFNSTSTRTLSITTVAEYDVRIVIRGADGVEASKSFRLTVYAVLTNKSTLSAENVYAGTKVTMNGAASGGTSPYTYAFYYKRNTNTKWVTLGTEFSSETSVSFTPKSAAVFDVRIVVKDSRGTTAEKVFTLTVKGALSNTSKLSASRIASGNALTITAAASGGNAPYTYNCYYKRASASSWNQAGSGSFTSSAVVQISPKVVSDYNAKVVVKDSDGTEIEKVMNFSVYAVLKNNSFLSAETVYAGTKVTMNGSASGGTSPYTYAFYYKRATNTKWVTLGTEFSSASTASLTPGSAAVFDVKIAVRDSKGETAEKSFTLTVKAPLSNTSTISASKVASGTTVTMTGSASGGASPYTYAFYYKRTSATNWNTLGTAFSSVSTASVTPKTISDYDIRIVVRDSDGTEKEKTMKLTVVAKLVNNSTVSAEKVVAGTRVTLTGAASGGIGAYTYAFTYKRSTNTNWTTLGTKFGTSKSESFTPGSEAVFDIRIYVRDSTGATVSKDYTLTVTPKLKNKSTISATTVSKGVTVTLVGKASGGTSPYTYAYYYKTFDNTVWRQIVEPYTGQVKVRFTPGSAKDYNLKVIAKDSSGKTDEVVFDLDVRPAAVLSNRSTVSATSVSAGTAVTFAGKAFGGEGIYTFAYYYKPTSRSSWTKIADFSEARTKSFTPAAGKYDLRVDVRDGASKIATKTFSLTVS